MPPQNELSTENSANELNLARYLDLVKRRWMIILLVGVIFAVAGFAYASAQPKHYIAEADLAVVRTGAIVNFDPKFRTVSDTDPTGQSLDSLTRRGSLLTVAQSPDFAAAVLEQIGPQLPEGLRSPTALLRMVNVTNNSDVIAIRATTDSPESAALLANTWMALYASRVNELFSQDPTVGVSVRTQQDQAKKDYDEKEAKFIAFTGNNPIENLTHQAALLQRQLDNQVTVASKLIELEADAQALRARVSQGSGDANSGDQLAQLLIQANAFNNGGDLPLQLNISAQNAVAPTTRVDQMQQLDSLITAIQARRDAVTGDAETKLHQQLATVQEQLEQAQAQQKELTAARDLAWGTYQLLSSKVSETNVSAGSATEMVRVAASAIAPSEPVDSRRLLFAIIGGLVGLLVGAAGAVAWDALPTRAAALQRAS